MTGIAITLSPDYGWVVMVVVSTFFMLMWLGIRVGKARKQYDVKYPKMYAEPFNHTFNCIQRAHQNTLEGYPSFLVLLLLGGLLYPRLSAVAGAVWVAGRVAYALGYSTGDPGKRQYGAFGYFGLFTLLGINIMFGLKLLGYMSW
ncbi:microsomal glutathione S-transferase 3-like [Mya arenaria]|uniref:microsomal glutathione S-transferase 3-like n=1 Tax=Mya arenaria TaxID=6604 RepID=UPI0022E8E039|nr:microsomal glutathione S-transferase 3-like [Mya arenaria]XP_052810818.1 microsomal glutathione S-transferase 3-like [Mya arenaria]XP_052810819.1 microsomal glutathione S-transferase 3-like [Mya arenaria]